MDLQLAQSRYRFGLASGEDLVAAALRLIEEGSDNPTACELACLCSPTVRDAGPLFERVLRELKVPNLDQARAERLVASDIARAITEGAVLPRDGFAEMEALREASDEGVRYWVLEAGVFYDGWADDPDENAALYAEFDKAVVDAARSMLARLAEETSAP